MGFMRALLARRLILKKNLPMIIGMCLAFYFCYHALWGGRSYVNLMILENRISNVEQEYNQLSAERAALEKKVSQLRPGSIDPDLLEERARYILGFVRPDETLVLGVN